MSNLRDFIVVYTDNTGEKHSVAIAAENVFSAIVTVNDLVANDPDDPQQRITVTSVLPIQQSPPIPTHEEAINLNDGQPLVPPGTDIEAEFGDV